MKFCVALCLAQIASGHYATAHHQSRLYPIPQRNLWGYINESGTIVIEPKFYACGEFSEGLAAARSGGTYGFIDRTGNYVIKPRFDAAYPFFNGLAKVFLGGVPYFVNRRGEIIFKHKYKSIDTFGLRSFAIVRTKSNRYGAIDRQGKLVVDTAFSYMGAFYCNRSIVSGLRHKPIGDNRVYEIGVIDTNGKWVVPYGTYSTIADFSHGYTFAQELYPLDATVPISSTNDSIVIVDSTGRRYFTLPNQMLLWYGVEAGGFEHGVAVARLLSRTRGTGASHGSSSSNVYCAILNADGIVRKEISWSSITTFSEGRAFVQYESGLWRMVDRQGRAVGNDRYHNIASGNPSSFPVSPSFEGGFAIVKTDMGWCAIDTSGRRISEPVLNNSAEISYSVYRRGNILFFSKFNSSSSSGSCELYGFVNIFSHAGIKPTFSDIQMSNESSGLMKAILNDTLCYISRSGEIVWRDSSIRDSTLELNIDYMNRGYYYLSEGTVYDLDSCKALKRWKTANPAVCGVQNTRHKLRLVFLPDLTTTWKGRYSAIKLFVVNVSSDTVNFDAQNCRFGLKLQARTRAGKWCDIEHLPNSWCGNSYHLIRMRPRRVVEFATPIYHGEFKTAIRAVIQYKNQQNSRRSVEVYSNEVSGSINPGQFWYKNKYEPSGIMDSYWE